MNYKWAMADSNTFDIGPIRKLIEREMLTDELWIDPFANKNKLAKITNDINPKYDTTYHMDALDFLKTFKDNSVSGVLYDPPYSERQINECYESFGLDKHVTNSGYWSELRDEISRIIAPAGKCISCGWNSVGVGSNRGFKKTNLLLVCHGGMHYDTIVTVEVKVNGSLLDLCFEDDNVATELI